MIYEAGIGRNLDTSHFLDGDFGDECIPHRHDYRFEFICTVEELDQNGFSTDISLLETAADGIRDELKGVLLNDLPFFRDKQPSVENMARYILSRMLSRLEELGEKKRFLRIKVTIRESPDAWASCIKEG
jgi:6-pyruvoyltetrahydropterin/6-carboxytetrahydropterin synthase